MEDHGLSLAAQKTEIVLLTKNRINTLRSFTVGDATVQTKLSVRYLGVMLDCKFYYGEHIIRVADKAAKVIFPLGTLVANVKGPRPCIRRRLMRAAEAVKLYGAKIRSEQETRGKWTSRLISRLENCITRVQGEVDFYLTQFLTGHSLFRTYLVKMRKVADGNCPYGESTVDDARHTFFICARWTAERFSLEQELGDISPEDIVEKVLRGQKEWNKVACYVRAILRKKKKEMGGP
ncbi:uncharacterized protein LOC124423613 [Vespa crabro]|uniref:uncharacterized protein LOC124423613 n=1 Tax=Vespa crabro TaxID=7445 RepID=UPI001EFFC908|nr:uncharacterized protein LOC124423613 [Vespa crabro]